MLGLGIVLAGGAAGLAALLIAYNLDGDATITPYVFGLALRPVNAVQVFVAGLALAFVFWFGVRLSGLGLARRNRMRSRLRKLEDERTRDEEADERSRSPVDVSS